MPVSCGQSPSATCTSEWQTPQASTWMRTSPASSAGRGTSSSARGFLNSCRTAAFIRCASARKQDDGKQTVSDHAGLFEEIRLRTRGLQKECHRAARAFAQIVRPRKPCGPPANHRGVEPFHEFRQVCHGKRARDFLALLPFLENVAQQTGGNLLGPPHLRRAHRVHGPREHHRAPQRSIRLHLARHIFIHVAQAFRGARLAGKLGLQMLLDAAEAASPDLAQNGILAREISEKCGLADFQGRNDILDSRVFVAILPKQANGSLDNLLPQPRLFPLAKSGCLSMAHAVHSRCTWPQDGCCVTRGLHSGHDLRSPRQSPQRRKKADRGKKCKSYSNMIETHVKPPFRCRIRLLMCFPWEGTTQSCRKSFRILRALAAESTFPKSGSTGR